MSSSTEDMLDRAIAKIKADLATLEEARRILFNTGAPATTDKFVQTVEKKMTPRGRRNPVKYKSAQQRQQEVREYLLQHGPAHMADVARNFAVSKTTVTSAIQHCPWFCQLENAQWALTPAGRAGDTPTNGETVQPSPIKEKEKC